MMLLSVYKNVKLRLPEVLEAPERKRREKLIEAILDSGYSYSTVGKVLPFFTRFLSFLVFQNTNPSTPLFFGDLRKSVH